MAHNANVLGGPGGGLYSRLLALRYNLKYKIPLCGCRGPMSTQNVAAEVVNHAKFGASASVSI